MYLLSPGGGMGASSYSFFAAGGFNAAEAEAAAGAGVEGMDRESLQVRGGSEVLCHAP